MLYLLNDALVFVTDGGTIGASYPSMIYVEVHLDSFRFDQLNAQPVIVRSKSGLLGAAFARIKAGAFQGTHPDDLPQVVAK